MISAFAISGVEDPLQVHVPRRWRDETFGKLFCGDRRYQYAVHRPFEQAARCFCFGRVGTNHVPRKQTGEPLLADRKRPKPDAARDPGILWFTR